MAMRKIFCPSCGQETLVNDEKPFSFCTGCGNKIVLRDQPKAVEEAPSDENAQADSVVDKKLEEAAFYYNLSYTKKEYENTKEDPIYYLKAQDLLIDLSEQYPDDYRIWWELCKPVDYMCASTGADIQNQYHINEDFFDKALDKADLPNKRKLIEEHDKYLSDKKNAAELANKRRIDLQKAQEMQRMEEERQRKEEENRLRAEEAERLRAEEEKRRKEEAERLKAAEEERRQWEEQRRREEAERLKAAEEERRQWEEQRRKEETERLEAERNQQAQLRVEEEIRKEREDRERESRQLNIERSAPLWQKLAQKDYSPINNKYFSLPPENGQTIVGVFRNVSNILYLNTFRIDGTKGNAVYREQSLAIRFNENGVGFKFDNLPITIKGFLPPDNILKLYTSSTGECMVNNLRLVSDDEYLKNLTARAKKPLFSFTKVFA